MERAALFSEFLFFPVSHNLSGAFNPESPLREKQELAATLVNLSVCKSGSTSFCYFSFLPRFSRNIDELFPGWQFEELLFLLELSWSIFLDGDMETAVCIKILSLQDLCRKSCSKPTFLSHGIYYKHIFESKVPFGTLKYCSTSQARILEARQQRRDALGGTNDKPSLC